MALSPATVPKRPLPATLAAELRATVQVLAADIGERNCYRPERLALAAAYVQRELAATGLPLTVQPYDIPADTYGCGAQQVANYIVERRGTTRPDEVLVVGAHYDSRVAMPHWHVHWPPQPERPGTPGANDNGSGLATLLALARMFADVPTALTVRFVAFANEEPPFYKTAAMGSLVYARACAAQRDQRVVGMFTMDTLGCYSVRPRTKRPLHATLFGLPDRPDYVALCSNRASRALARRCATVLRAHTTLGVRTLALPGTFPTVSWSDDWSFWQVGVPAFCVTDTAFLRHDDYHELSDTVDGLDYPAFAEVVWGLRAVVAELAGATAP